jgi:hypothetical protein
LGELGLFEYFRTIGREGRSGKIQIEVYPCDRILMKGRDTGLMTRLANASCILLDEPFGYLASSRVRTLLNGLEKMEKQVILASKRTDVKGAVPSKNTIRIRAQLT